MNKFALLTAALLVLIALKHHLQEHPAHARASASASVPVAATAAAKPQTSAPAHGEGPAAPVERFRRDLTRLQACYDHNCSYPELGPHDYEFALEEEIAAKLNAMAEWIRNDGLTDETVSETARGFVFSQNAGVQEAALKVLATQPPSPKNLQSILEGALQGANAELTGDVLRELRRYTDPRDVQTVTDAFADVLATGSPLTADEVAAHIQPFIGPANYDRLSDLVQSLPEDSRIRSQLEASLERFRLGFEGG
jgi:hypothetical protein